MPRRMRSQNLFIVGGLFLTFFVGTITGSFVKRYRTPPAYTGVVSEDENVRSLASEGRESSGLLAADERCWDVRRIPLSLLKIELQKRSSDKNFDSLLRERFPLSTNEQLALVQRRQRSAVARSRTEA